MKVKFLKKSLSLLLALCMVLSYVPVNLHVHAAETTAPSVTVAYPAESTGTDFYKIVHLDAGRKYFSKDVIINYIDLLAANGLNQLQLYLSDNQGFRFALDNMTITTSYGDYDLSLALGNGYDQDYDGSHLSWYRPSYEDKWLTQGEMTEIIKYAHGKGIEIVPCINMPGHMGAILDQFDQFRYTDSAGNKSKSSINLSNAEAYAFALGILDKYAKYFSEQECKYFHIGGDEYAYDLPNYNINSVCNNETTYSKIVEFMNAAASKIKSYGMTPRAFNDFFGWNGNHVIDKDFEITFWASAANGQAMKSLTDLQNMGYTKFINTNEGWYFALGSKYYTLSWTQSGVNGANVNQFVGGTVENPLGAQFCIWNDRGRLDEATSTNGGTNTVTYHNYSDKVEPVGGDAGKSVYDLTKPFVETFGTKMPVDPVTINHTKSGITVSAPNLTELWCSDEGVMNGTQVMGADKTMTYTVTPKTKDGDYTGNAQVTMSIPEGWDTTKLFAYVVNSDGTITKLSGDDLTIEGNTCTFTLSQFGQCGLGLNRDNYNPYHEFYVNAGAEYTSDACVLDGKLLEESEEYTTVGNLATYTVEHNEDRSGITSVFGKDTRIDSMNVGDSITSKIGNGTYYMMAGGAAVQDAANATDWTITRVEKGYTIQTGSNYIQCSYNAVPLGTEPFVWSWSSTSGFYGVTTTMHTVYICLWDATNGFYTSTTGDGTAPYVLTGTSGESTWTTTVTFTAGSNNGIDTVAIGGNQFSFQVINGNEPEEHDHVYSVPATCQKKASCEICGVEDPYSAVSAHTYTIRANCSSARRCGVCGIADTVENPNIDPTFHDGATEVRGREEATTTSDGYTGDTWCLECGKQIETGTTIPKLEAGECDHTGGTATCVAQATCTTCGEPYGTMDANNHVGEIKTENGTETYTYCTSCTQRIDTWVKKPDSTTNVTVTAWNQATLTVKSVTTDYSAEITGASSTVAYDITLTYSKTPASLEAIVTLPVSEDVNTVIPFMVDNGEVVIFGECDVEDGYVTFEVPHFTVVGYALKAAADDGTSSNNTVTVKEGETASITLDGQVGTEGETYYTTNSLASYTVKHTTTEGETIPEWNASTAYSAGDRVTYGGKVYEAKWYSQGDNPSASGEWGAWKEVTDVVVASTTTTITFTGITAGTDTATIDGVTITVVVQSADEGGEGGETTPSETISITINYAEDPFHTETMDDTFERGNSATEGNNEYVSWKVTEGASVPTWSSDVDFEQGAIVVYEGTSYYAPYNKPASTDVPGVSDKWLVVEEWDSTSAGYSLNLVVKHNGEYYRATGWCDKGVEPGAGNNNWTKVAGGSSVTTITFTAKGQNCENVTVPIGNKTFVVTVTGGEYDCGNHQWAWTSEGDTHWQYCTTESCTVTQNEGSHSGDQNATCMTAGTCTSCGAEYYDSDNHAWEDTYTSDESGHWYACSNEEHTDAKSGFEEHTIVGATCTTEGECECGYKDTDPDNHTWQTDENGYVYGSDSKEHWHICAECDATGTHESHGGTVTEPGYPATEETEGRTDKYRCDVCGVEYGGEVIPVLGVDYQKTINLQLPFTTTDGSTDVQTQVIPGENPTAPVIPTSGEVRQGDTVIATFTTSTTSNKVRIVKGEQTSVLTGERIIGVDGKYLVSTALTGGGTIDEATFWNIQAVDGGYTIQTPDGKYLTQSAQTLGLSDTSVVWQWSSELGFHQLVDNNTVCLAYNNGWYAHYSTTPGNAIGLAYIPTVSYETTYTTNVSFTPVAVGSGTVTFGNTEYTVNVTSLPLDQVDPVTLQYWITCIGVTGSDNAKSKTVTAIEANSVAGVDISTLVAATGTNDEGAPVVFWKGTKLASGFHQAGPSSHDTNDRTHSGYDFRYIRYWDYKWSVSSTGKADDWQDILPTDQLVAYYLQDTDIAEEIDVLAKDWGYETSGNIVGSNENPKDGQVSLSFGLVYTTNTMNPLEENLWADTTVVYHYWEGRDIGYMMFEDTDNYEVYKVTITPGVVTPSSLIGTTSDWQGIANGVQFDKVNVTDDEGNVITDKDGNVIQWFDEVTVWDENQNAGTTPYLDAVSLAHTEATAEYGDKIIWDDSGNAYLILLYIREIVNEDTLTVRYFDDTNVVEEGADNYSDYMFNSYYINVEEGHTFANSLTPGFSTTLQDDSTIVNAVGITEHIYTDLLKLQNLYGTKYVSGAYHFTRAELSEDGKTLDLHYNKGETKYMVVDFGLMAEVTADILDIEDGWSITKITTPTRFQLNYGTLRRYDANGNLITSGSDTVCTKIVYEPIAVMQMPDFFSINVVIKNNTSGVEVDVDYGIYVVPATTVYYEEGFATYNGSWADISSNDSKTAATYTNGGKFQQSENPTTKFKYNYGYDPVYAVQANGKSNGTEAKSTVVGDTATFSFAGTGFELYANTTTSSGIAMVTVRNSSGSIVKVMTVDTHMEDSTLEGSAATGQAVTAYNVPIVAVKELSYGTYSVEIRHLGQRNTNSVAPIMIDGFRIYNTMDNRADSIYVLDGEATPVFQEVRDAVLATVYVASDTHMYAEQISDNIWSQVYASGTNENIQALILSTGTTQTGVNDEQAVRVDYLVNGPKNEVYLKPGDTLVLATGEYTYQLGMKALNANVSVTYTAPTSNGMPENKTVTMTSSTDMYYPVISDNSGVIRITNNEKPENSSAILAVTMMKGFAYGTSSGDVGVFGQLDSDDVSKVLTDLGFAAASTEHADVEYVGNSLSLKGDIGLNFYYNLSEKVLNDANAYIQFTVDGVTQTVPVSEGKLDESDGSYGFSVKLNAKNMGDEVTAQFYTSEGAVGESKTTSIKAYADYAIANSSKETLVNLMKAMLNYGAAAQVEFGHNTDKLVNADLSDADRLLPESVDVSGYASSISGAENGITLTSASLVLQSETKIRVYFTLAEGKSIDDYTFTVDGQEVTPVVAGSEYYIEKTNVAAKDLDTMSTFELGGLTLNYCGLSYVNVVKKYSAKDTDLMDLAKALYVYNQAANAYFG